MKRVSHPRFCISAVQGPCSIPPVQQPALAPGMDRRLSSLRVQRSFCHTTTRPVCAGDCTRAACRAALCCTMLGANRGQACTRSAISHTLTRAKRAGGRGRTAGGGGSRDGRSGGQGRDSGGEGAAPLGAALLNRAGMHPQVHVHAVTRPRLFLTGVQCILCKAPCSLGRCCRNSSVCCQYCVPCKCARHSVSPLTARICITVTGLAGCSLSWCALRSSSAARVCSRRRSLLLLLLQQPWQQPTWVPPTATTRPPEARRTRRTQARLRWRRPRRPPNCRTGGRRACSRCSHAAACAVPVLTHQAASVSRCPRPAMHAKQAQNTLLPLLLLCMRFGAGLHAPSASPAVVNTCQLYTDRRCKLTHHWPCCDCARACLRCILLTGLYSSPMTAAAR